MLNFGTSDLEELTSYENEMAWSYVLFHEHLKMKKKILKLHLEERRKCQQQMEKRMSCLQVTICHPGKFRDAIFS